MERYDVNWKIIKKEFDAMFKFLVIVIYIIAPLVFFLQGLFLYSISTRYDQRIFVIIIDDNIISCSACCWHFSHKKFH